VRVCYRESSSYVDTDREREREKEREGECVCVREKAAHIQALTEKDDREIQRSGLQSQPRHTLFLRESIFTSLGKAFLLPTTEKSR